MSAFWAERYSLDLLTEVRWPYFARELLEDGRPVLPPQPIEEVLARLVGWVRSAQRAGRLSGVECRGLLDRIADYATEA